MAPRNATRVRFRRCRFLPALMGFVCILFLFPFKSNAFSRIISLKPNITEILFALGAGPRVVGVTTFCKRPKEAEALPKIADYIRAYPEEILRLQPDLIIGSTENSSEKEVYFLMERGFTVQLFPFGTIEETLQSIRAIGKLLDKTAKAEQITAQMENKLKALKARANSIRKKRVLFVVGYQPLVVAGSGNFFDESTEYLGLENVVRESRLPYPTYTTELLIRAAPEIIIDMTMGTEKTLNHETERRAWWNRFSSIPAVQQGKIFFFDIEKMRATPNLPDALQEIFSLIHSN